MNILSTTVTRAASVVILIVLLSAVQVEAASPGRSSLAAVTYGSWAVAALLVMVIVALVAKLVKQHGAVKAMTRMAALLIVVCAALGGIFGLFAFSASLHQGGYPHNQPVVLRDFACALLIAILSIALLIRVSRRHPELKMMKGVIQLILALVCAVGPPVVFIAFVAKSEEMVCSVALAACVVSIPVLICVASATIMLQRRSGMSDRFVALAVGLAPLVWMCADGLRHRQAIVVALVGLACLAAVSGAAAWLCARRAWDQRGRLRAAAIIVTTLVFYVYLAWDAPTQKAYTWEDIPVPTTDVEASRQTLCKLTKTASPLLRVETPGGQGANYGRRRTPWAPQNCSPIEKLMDDFGRKATPAEVLACAEQIERAWVGSTNYRAVIAELDAYPAIPCTGRGIYAPLINYLEFRKAMPLCALHARLKTYQGAATEGASNLVQFYSVVRKRLPYSNMLVDKMVLIAAAGVAVDAAYKMASAPEATPESLHVLRRAFTPLTKEEITLGPALIGGYCDMADIVNAFPTNREPFLTQGTDNAVVRAVHRVTAPFVCNAQATLRGYLDVMGPVIVGASESPMRGVYDTRNDERNQYVYIKNPLGHALLSMCIPNCLEAKKKANMRKVQSDLLALQLSAKLGEPCGIKDWFTGRDYLHDQKTDLPFCAGPDGREGGGDDIFLNQ